MVVSIPSPRAPPPARHAASAHGPAVRTAAWPRRDRCRPAPFYRPRRTHDSPLFQLLERHFAEFERVYAERFAPSFGHWRPIVAGTVAKFLRCGDLHEGFARVKCRACKHEFFVAFSCKQRCVCASCHQKRSLILSDRLAAEVCAEVAHRQFVFTMPKRLRVFFRFDRALLGDLARLAWETVLEVYRATLGRDDLVPGMVAGIQTFGELIHWHPHIHALAPDGAFDETGTFHPLPAVAVEPFRELFAHKVLGLLLARGKIGAEVVENIRSWKHSGFSVDKSVRIEAGDRAGLLRDLRHSAATGTGAGRRARRGR
jgi:hypothetical protein